MSTLRVNTLQNAAGTSDPAISGAAKAWVNFNGTSTVAIRASFNVSSITDNGTGDYTVNFTNAMTDANYAVQIMGNRDATGNFGYLYSAPYNQSPTASTVRIATTSTSTFLDFTHVFVTIFR